MGFLLVGFLRSTSQTTCIIVISFLRSTSQKANHKNASVQGSEYEYQSMVCTSRPEKCPFEALEVHGVTFRIPKHHVWLSDVFAQELEQASSEAKHVAVVKARYIAMQPSDQLSYSSSRTCFVHHLL